MKTQTTTQTIGRKNALQAARIAKKTDAQLHKAQDAKRAAYLAQTPEQRILANRKAREAKAQLLADQKAQVEAIVGHAVKTCTIKKSSHTTAQLDAIAKATFDAGVRLTGAEADALSDEIGFS